MTVDPHPPKKLNEVKTEKEKEKRNIVSFIYSFCVVLFSQLHNS